METILEGAGKLGFFYLLQNLCEKGVVRTQDLWGGK